MRHNSMKMCDKKKAPPKGCLKPNMKKRSRQIY